METPISCCCCCCFDIYVTTLISTTLVDDLHKNDIFKRCHDYILGGSLSEPVSQATTNNNHKLAYIPHFTTFVTFPPSN